MQAHVVVSATQTVCRGSWSVSIGSRAGVVVAVLVAVGCGGESGDTQAEVPDPPRDIVSAVEYAPELGIDLDTFTRSVSGLYQRDIEAGTGEPAQSGQVVVVHYTGWLSDGAEFDSNLGAEPIEFPLGVGFVIQGWDEGLSGLRVGGRRRLVIPPELGYGSEGRGAIPPNAVLVFDVELLDVRYPPVEELP